MSIAVNTVTSADGTQIAFERLGNDEPIIMFGGATCDRAMMRPDAEAVAQHATVINYDRRGRGGSSDVTPYAIQREIEDIAALVDEVGGAACLYGHSSGAALVLHAAAQDLPITAFVLHEPPYSPPTEAADRDARAYAARLEALLAADDRPGAAALFMGTVGMPPEAVEQMRGEPWFANTAAIAHTLAYDSEIMGDRTGGTVPGDLVTSATAPALVIRGGASPDWMIAIGRQFGRRPSARAVRPPRRPGSQPGSRRARTGARRVPRDDRRRAPRLRGAGEPSRTLTAGPTNSRLVQPVFALVAAAANAAMVGNSWS